MARAAVSEELGRMQAPRRIAQADEEEEEGQGRTSAHAAGREARAARTGAAVHEAGGDERLLC